MTPDLIEGVKNLSLCHTRPYFESNEQLIFPDSGVERERGVVMAHLLVHEELLSWKTSPIVFPLLCGSPQTHENGDFKHITSKITKQVNVQELNRSFHSAILSPWCSSIVRTVLGFPTLLASNRSIAKGDPSMKWLP